MTRCDIIVEEHPITKVIIYELERLSIDQIKKQSLGIVAWCDGYLISPAPLPDLERFSNEIVDSNTLHFAQVCYCKMEIYPTKFITTNNQEIMVMDNSFSIVSKSIVEYIKAKENET